MVLLENGLGNRRYMHMPVRYDRKDVGRIHLKDLRRHAPSVMDAWKQLAEHEELSVSLPPYP